MIQTLFGVLRDVPTWEAVLLFVLVGLVLGYVGAGIPAWTLLAALALYGWGAPTGAWVAVLVFVLVFGFSPFRRLISRLVMQVMRSADFLPTISRTEREAIDAGSVGLEGELFSGKPDLMRLAYADYPGLTAEERAFLDGPVQALCDLVDDWEVFQTRDLSPATWEHLARHRFFGLIIPKTYGGYGFSASANSAVVAKTASASPVLGITVMVPNSLGPAELLIHYGTDEQKEWWLPRLARHEEIPAFALTEPGAGSDAGAITARGEVFRAEDGRLMLCLSWNKRYITLAPIATVLGLAFKLRDPKDLLGKGVDPGITCALVSTSTPGVRVGERHDPMGVPFLNGPTYGTDVVVPLEESVIGGLDGVGRGWTMLMESLAAGRGISLPATATAGVKHVARVASAHAVVRKQFSTPIGRFEGIEEPLARIAGLAYLLEAARRYTCGALDAGDKPAVVTAMMKYYATEAYRDAVNDGMDILGGSAISRGPDNALAHPYMYLPVPITVEGANILTRTLMIFGQGAIRCHPYVLAEVTAVEAGDVRAFDEALWGHFGHVVRNKVRSFVLSLFRGGLSASPVRGPAARYWRRLAWASATFAFWSDIALATLGGDLKRKEKITGRFADIFAWMYLSTAVLRRFEADGRRTEDVPFLHWCLQTSLHNVQRGFDGLFENLTIPGMTWFIRGPVAAWSRFNRLSAPPGDALGSRIAQAIQVPGPQRERLLGGIHVGSRPVARLERAMALCYDAEPIHAVIRNAVRTGRLRRASPALMVESALAAGVISKAEADRINRAEEARNEAIQVASFDEETYFATASKKPPKPKPAITPPAEPPKPAPGSRAVKKPPKPKPATTRRNRKG